MGFNSLSLSLSLTCSFLILVDGSLFEVRETGFERVHGKRELVVGFER